MKLSREKILRLSHLILGQLDADEAVEYFADPQGVPGATVDLWAVTATVESKIWRGLVGRLEYRHDQANRNAFSVRNIGGRGLAPTSDAQNTITFALYYSFF